jgi:hypothetical protein
MGILLHARSLAPLVQARGFGMTRVVGEDLIQARSTRDPLVGECAGSRDERS